MNYTTIKELISDFYKAEGVKYFPMIFDFFAHPKKFWKSFIELNARQKLVQFAIYTAIIVVVVFALSNSEYGINEVVKFLLRETATLLPLWVVSATVICATNKFKEVKSSAVYAFFIVYYAKALFCTIQSIFLYLYVNSESYIWLFLATVVSVAAEIYIIYVSILIAGLDTSRKRAIWLGIIFSIISFAAVDGANMLWETGRTVGEQNFSNNINDERQSRLSGLSTEFLIPQAVLYCSVDSIILVHSYLYAMPNDTELLRLNESDEAYLSKIKSDITLLKSTLPHTRYEANRKYIQDMIRIKEAVVYTFEHKNFSMNHQYHYVLTKDSSSFDLYLVAFNDDISQDNAELMKSYCWQICQYDMAMSPTVLQLLYRPLLIIPYIKDEKSALAPRSVNAWKTYFDLKDKQHTYHLTFK